MSSTVVGRAPAAPRTAFARAHEQWAWLAAGLAVAFALPFLFADAWTIPRDGYYGVYVATVIAFLALWLRSLPEAPTRLVRRRWPWAVLLGIGFGAALVPIVLNETATSHPYGWTFAGAIVWRGIAYGVTDGLLLSSFPILAVFAAFSSRPLRERRKRAVAGIGALALAVSLVFTAAYHVGYPDFRGEKLKKPLAGDLVWSMPTLLTLNPIGAPIAHAVLHTTAVVHAYRTDTFLPPHHATTATLSGVR